MVAKLVFYKLLYTLTVYLPLKIRDLCIDALGIFIKREYLIETASKLLKEKSLKGMLPDGNVIFYPLDDFKLLSIISEIYYKKIYSSKQIESFKFICDVGAHIGLFTLWVSSVAPNSKIIAIEPNSTNFKFLFKNILVNHLEHRVQTLNVAAGDKNAEVELWEGKLSRGDSSIVKGYYSKSVEHQPVHMCPLGDILSKDENCDLIKIDAEGAEVKILWGLQGMLRRINLIIMELHISLIQVTEIYEILARYHFVMKRNQKLYESCWLLEAKRAEL
jgi:FkbM family methyltransferase